MRVVTIVQARMGSSRLPGKVLLPVAGAPLILHMLRRVARCRRSDALWLATSTAPENDALEEAVIAEGFRVFRGSEHDVLSRYAEIARRESADLVVRLTGDCPLHDPGVIDQIITFARNNASDYDYISNALIPTYPDGLDVEICTRAALEEADARATSPLLREHVMPYIHRFHDGPGPFRVFHYRGEADFSHLRWTLDEAADYELIRQVYQALLPSKSDFSWLDVVALLTARPSLLEINGHIARNEGFSGISLDSGSLTLRSVRLDDACALWALANDEAAAANRFSSGPIEIDAHIDWLRRKLASPSTRLWILVGGDGIAGQIRYDRSEDEIAEIDYAVAESHRGSGIGAALLRRTWDSACRELGVSAARGIVFASNGASIRAFEKGGFERTAETVIQGRPCVVFERRLADDASVSGLTARGRSA